MKRKTRSLRWLPKLLMPVVVLAAFLLALSRLDSGSTEVQRQQLEDSIRRACVACYAAEGIYPPNVEYLEEHYGVVIDHDRYHVSYVAIADNLMPDITVLEK